MSYGRRLSPDHIAALVRRINEYLDTIARRAPKDYEPHAALTLDNFPHIVDQSYYKYISEETWGYNKDGSFQLGTASYYRSTPNMKIKDEREGASDFHLAHGTDQLNVSIMSGFNAAIYCGTGAMGDRALMSSRFGVRLIKIYPVREFAERIAHRIGATDFHVYDVVYTDQKNFFMEKDDILAFRHIVMQHPRGDLTPESLHALNKRFFHLFHQIGRMPSLFSKPVYYAPERERRIVFEFSADLKTETIRLTDRSLLDFIELL
jgi:hypothetical protein